LGVLSNGFTIEPGPGRKKTLDSGIHAEVYNARVMGEFLNKGFWRASELAQAAGISTDTLRHYERKGVLTAPRRSANGYREYPAEALARVRLVRRALAIGFTLDELARIFKARDRGGAPCREVRALAAAKLSGVEAQLRELVALRDELRATLQDWDARLANTAASERAGLLETLIASDSSNDPQHVPLAPAWRRRKRKELSDEES
jgi:DNA-binding transcriptional MerR regulator